MVERRLDCEDCRHLTVVGLHDTSPRSSHTSDSKIGAQVAALPGAGRNRVGSRTGWPSLGSLHQSTSTSVVQRDRSVLAQFASHMQGVQFCWIAKYRGTWTFSFTIMRNTVSE